MKTLMEREREILDKKRIIAMYKWRHSEWLKIKINSLYESNPEYADKIRNGQANPPYSWSWDSWYEREKYNERDCSNKR